MNDNVDSVKRTYEALNRGDIEQMLSKLAATFEWVEPAGSPFGGVLRTREELVEKVLLPFNAEFEGQFMPEDGIEADGKVMVRGQLSGTHRRSGKKITMRYAAFIEFRDDKVVRFEHFFDTAIYARIAS